MQNLYNNINKNDNYSHATFIFLSVAIYVLRRRNSHILIMIVFRIIYLRGIAIFGRDFLILNNSYKISRKNSVCNRYHNFHG